MLSSEEKAQIEGLALRRQNWMQLFALFNVFDISLAEKKLVSLPCELSCRGVCITDPAGLGEKKLIQC